MSEKPKKLLFESYLAAVSNSVGSNMWRNFYVEVDGQKVDVMRDGELSCAFFVSTILTLFQMIDRPHATVDKCVDMLQEDDRWSAVDSPFPGDVIIYGATTFEDGESHKHIGFYIDETSVISNSFKEKTPISHHPTLDGTREIANIFRYEHPGD